MYKNNYPHKRYRITLEFLKKYIDDKKTTIFNVSIKRIDISHDVCLISNYIILKAKNL